MIQQAQVELAKTFFEQSKKAFEQNHAAWRTVLASQKSIMESMRAAGVPFAVAADEFQKVIDFHEQQHKAALDFMTKMQADYAKTVAAKGK
ncbi:hypothetical protein CDN99_21785 [Roseateles aquatilis]|uniref:Phasin domain-containing protein n=1 Tax=Roseateles aquatilis TaxID=431061 RepID=A0A246IZD7_9BURK|nr:hypothetical protein [Roseateles aquatilis]OWQ85711.1 hypothetical protein CDN99_21785 [Roseateles aquatilis]